MLLVVLSAGLFLVLPFALSWGAPFFLPITTAIILCIAMSPLADLLTRLGLPNALASPLAILLTIASLAAIAFVVVEPSIELLGRLPALIGQVARQLDRVRGSLDGVSRLFNAIAQLGEKHGPRTVVLAGPSLFERVALATPHMVLSCAFTMLMAYFMVEARQRVRRNLLLQRSDFDTSVRAARAIRAIQEQVASYLATITVINLMVGVIVGFMAWALNLDNPAQWGRLAALLNFLPYIGPMIMVALLLAFGLATAGNLFTALIPVIAYIALHVVEANLVTPGIMGRRFAVNPLAVLIAISYFGWIWGVLGAFLAVPLMVMLKALLEHLGTPNFIGFLLGEPLRVRQTYAQPAHPVERGSSD